MSYHKHFSFFLRLRVLLTAQADGNSHSSCQRAQSLIDSQPKSGREKRERTQLIEYHFSDSSRVKTEALPKKELDGKDITSLRESRESASPGQSSGLQSFQIKSSYITKENQTESNYLCKVQGSQSSQQKIQQQQPPFRMG